MLGFTHTLVSLPFGIFFDNWLLAGIAAFMFHLFCDTLLHWNIYPQNYPRYPYGLVALDVAAGLSASYLVLGQELLAPTFFAALIGGNLPDIMHTLWQLLHLDKVKMLNAAKPFFIFHERIQQETDDRTAGLTSQVILVGIALWLLL